MRTGIYVYSESAIFTINQEVVALPNAGGTVTTNGSQVTLTTGVYKTASSELQPTAASDYDIVVVGNDKDPWPDPPPRFWKAFTTTTSQQLSNFFPTSFGEEAAESDATVVCDEEDWPTIQDILAKAGFTSKRAA